MRLLIDVSSFQRGGHLDGLLRVMGEDGAMAYCEDVQDVYFIGAKTAEFPIFGALEFIPERFPKQNLLCFVGDPGKGACAAGFDLQVAAVAPEIYYVPIARDSELKPEVIAALDQSCVLVVGMHGLSVLNESTALIAALGKAHLILVENETDREHCASLGQFSGEVIEVKSYAGICDTRDWCDKALPAINKIRRQNVKLHATEFGGKPKPRMAVVSPLPPSQTGIAKYTADLISELKNFYSITVIIEGRGDGVTCQESAIQVASAVWFASNHEQFDRIVFHFGNSPFHAYMAPIFERIPGVVVLHDLYLGGLYEYLESHEGQKHEWTRAIYESHGYGSLRNRYRLSDREVVSIHPSSARVLSRAKAILLHSIHAASTLEKWYGRSNQDKIHVVPLVRETAVLSDKAEAKIHLGFLQEDYLVCCFGLLGETKQNLSVCEAWKASSLYGDPRARLIFVGQATDEYARSFVADLELGNDNIAVTGWVEDGTYQTFLSACDCAVQLRKNSRGESSASLADCINYGVPTIANAHGAQAELPADVAVMLADKFDQRELVAAIELLRQDSILRDELSRKARKYADRSFSAAECAKQHFELIERCYEKQPSTARDFIYQQRAVLRSLSENMLFDYAVDLVQAFRFRRHAKTLFVDVTATALKDLRTGIQRVVRAILSELIQINIEGYRVEPVYLTDEGGYWHYRYARKWMSGVLNIPGEWGHDEHIDVACGDSLLVLDFTSTFATEAGKAGLYDSYIARGCRIDFVAYDLLPLLLPDKFPPHATSGHLEWMETVSRLARNVVCISDAVASDVRNWLAVHGGGTPKVSYFHLGADIGNSMPSRGMPKNAEQVLTILRSTITFLMVGTIEPRKGHRQALEAALLLWEEGYEFALCIVGKEGWMMSELAEQIKAHPLFGRHLFWLDGVSDEYLSAVYAASDCLLAASEGEGFGLPLIEAAQHCCPIIARDIPVFREVAGEHAFYFVGDEGHDLADAMKVWIALMPEGKVPSCDGMKWLTWQQSARSLMSAIGMTALA